MTLSDNGPSMDLATSALIQSAGLKLGFSPFFAGNRDHYLSADFVLRLSAIYDGLSFDLGLSGLHIILPYLAWQKSLNIQISHGENIFDGIVNPRFNIKTCYSYTAPMSD